MTNLSKTSNISPPVRSPSKNDPPKTVMIRSPSRRPLTKHSSMKNSSKKNLPKKNLPKASVTLTTSTTGKPVPKSRRFILLNRLLYCLNKAILPRNSLPPLNRPQRILQNSLLDRNFPWQNPTSSPRMMTITTIRPLVMSICSPGMSIRPPVMTISLQGMKFSAICPPVIEFRSLSHPAMRNCFQAAALPHRNPPRRFGKPRPQRHPPRYRHRSHRSHRSHLSCHRAQMLRTTTFRRSP